MMRRLTTRQYNAIQMLVDGRTIASINKDLSLKRNTLSRWLRNEEFMDCYGKRMSDMHFSMQSNLTQVLQESIETAHYTVSSLQGDPKRIQALLAVIRAFPIMTEKLPALPVAQPKGAKNPPLPDVSYPSMHSL